MPVQGESKHLYDAARGPCWQRLIYNQPSGCCRYIQRVCICWDVFVREGTLQIGVCQWGVNFPDSPKRLVNF